MSNKETSSNKVQIVVGGQYGSEAKGTIAAYLAMRDPTDFCVRTGATNAGHTVVYGGVRYAMQQLPVGWVNPSATLVLGAGTLIDPAILQREIEMVNHATGSDIRRRLVVDYRAYIHRSEHQVRSKKSDRHHLMGATGKGCSEALTDRIKLRGLEDWTVGNMMDEGDSDYDMSAFAGVQISDTELLLNEAWDGGAKIQLEGTQGQLLDLYLGPYPYTTHKQTGPAQWMLECGLSPGLPTDIVMVVRTMPIRVAGNSGPLANETCWPDVVRGINFAREKSAGLMPYVSEDAIGMFELAVRTVTSQMWAGKVPPDSDGTDQHQWSDSERLLYREAASEIHAQALMSLDEPTVAELRRVFEVTTVTKKLRRIAVLNPQDLANAARQIRPDRVAVTFLNYVFPTRWATRTAITNPERGWLSYHIESVCHAPVFLINRGPDPDHIVEV